jgi:hypothetical protein
MCAVVRELRISLNDLQSAVMSCRKCGTDVTFDLMMEYRSPRAASGKTTATPEKCPACECPFDQRAQESIDALRDAFRAIEAQESVAVGFRVKFDGA